MDRRWRCTAEQECRKAACEQAGVEYVRPNDGTRHAFATHEVKSETNLYPSRGVARVPCDRITVIGTRDSEDGGSFTYPHLRQRERERLQERRDQVYDELQRLQAQLD